MEDIRTRPLSALEGPSWHRTLPQALVLLYLFLGLFSYMLAPFFALNWISTPFIGAFVEQTMLFNGTGPVENNAAAWPARAHVELREYGAQLLAINGQPVRSSVELQAALKQHQVGEEVQLQVRRRDTSVKDFAVRLAPFGLGDQLTYFYFPSLIGLVYLGA